MTSYAAYIPMPALPVGPSSSYSQLPGEVASSSSSGYPVYPAYHSYQNGHCVSAEQQQHHLQHTSSTKRRSLSNSYHPYFQGHETARSPTRTRFFPPVLVSTGYGSTHNDALNSSTPPRKVSISDALHAHKPSLVQGQERPKYKAKRLPPDESVESLSRVALVEPVAHKGPTNHVLVPQAVFKEPASSSDFRYKNLTFERCGFPEPGIRVRDILSRNFRLERAEELSFKKLHVSERIITLQIMWPGYAPYLFKLKTDITHETTANKLQGVMTAFRSAVQDGSVGIVDPALAWHWKISRFPGDHGIDLEQLFITQLVHRGGCHWQVELWAPRTAY